MLTAEIIQGDALQELQKLKAGSVHCCVTSPPYWGLRDYQVSGQLGLENTPEEYVGKMVEVFREVRRVLRPDGTLWLNLGDSYASFRDGKATPDTTRGEDTGTLVPKGEAKNRMASRFVGTGIKHKDLVGIPWRVAFALQADGWYLRCDIIWHKPNPMPESVTDRPTKSHEYLFLLSKSQRYYYDSEAIKEPAQTAPHNSGYVNGAEYAVGPMDRGGNSQREDPERVWAENGLRNRRSVWTVNPMPYSEAHFATFPPDLIKPCILAGTSAKGCCPKCGSPWERMVEKTASTMNIRVRDNAKGIIDKKSGVHGRYKASEEEVKNYGPEKMGESKTIGWKPSCKCAVDNTVPCTVLDPFAGSGTTGMVSLELGRRAILIELNPKYVDLIRSRTNVTPGLALA